jgi:hypothetical protein
MKTRFFLSTALLFPMVASGNSAFAQSMQGSGMPSVGGGGGTTRPGTTGGTSMGGMSNGVGSYYGGGGGGSGGVATIEGSYLSGAATLAEGLGKYNYDSARAARQIEDATHQAIENRLLAQMSYYESRALNKANWLADHPRSTPEQLAQINQWRLPRRLNSSDLDPTWGVIRWPAVLERPEFEKMREQFDDIFAHRSDERFGVGSAVHSQTQSLAHAMRTSLDEQRASMSQMEWIQAMRFIESLAYETRFAPDIAAGKYTVAK